MGGEEGPAVVVGGGVVAETVLAGPGAGDVVCGRGASGVIVDEVAR